MKGARGPLRDVAHRRTVYACIERLHAGTIRIEPLPTKALVRDLVTEIAPPDGRLVLGARDKLSGPRVQRRLSVQSYAL